MWLASKFFGYYIPRSTTSHLYHVVDVALGAGELGGVLGLDEDDEVEVVPHVVLHADVLFVRDVLVVERLALQA